MVAWDSTERGYPISENEGTRGCYLSCGVCEYTVKWTWAEIWTRWPVGTFTRDIARSLNVLSAVGVGAR